MDQQEYGRTMFESSAVGNMPKVPIIEPVLPVVDEWSRDILTNALFYENEGKIHVKYPDILNALGVVASHLEKLINLTWELAQSRILDIEGLILDPLLDKYHRNPEATQIILLAQSLLYGNVLGGSIRGSHQDFLVRYRGSDRRLEIRRGEDRER